MRPRCTVDDGADRGEVDATDRTRRNWSRRSRSDADAELGVALADLLEQHVAARCKALLDLAGREQRLRGMVLLLDWKVEDREQGIADRLVDQAVIVPDRGGAVV